MASLRAAYARTMHHARNAASSVGLLAALERRRDNRTALWARSLFAIYDIEDMTRLDLPWWTFDAIAKVDKFLSGRSDARVFEYGSGASTIWLARRASEVISVEHDESWYPIVQSRLREHPHVRLQLVSPDPPGQSDALFASTKAGWKGRTFRRYVQALDAEEGQFDLIVIDGRARVSCLEAAKSKLKRDGMIVFDNSHRAHYRKAIARAAVELTSERTRGLTACLPYPDETTLLRPRER